MKSALSYCRVCSTNLLKDTAMNRTARLALEILLLLAVGRPCLPCAGQAYDTPVAAVTCNG